MEKLQYPIEEVAGKKEKTQKEHLMEVDTWMDILFIQMEADYKEMHRLPKKLTL